MAVTKRTRFEVLKRDNYTCRYCRSAEESLTIDHVTPVALGGSDAPQNLVACCKDCNAGKSSTSPDAPLVADVAADALRWATAMKLAVSEQIEAGADCRDYIRRFADFWERRGDAEDLPLDWEATVRRWWKTRVPLTFLIEAIHITYDRPYLDHDRALNYVAGIVKSKMSDATDRALELIERETV